MINFTIFAQQWQSAVGKLYVTPDSTKVGIGISNIQENKHLPEIPSAEQMQENGVSLDKLVIQLLQKVEELTIYTIQLEERIKQLETNQKL